jgi:drug/metabolite transporter (DMT)-like permease
MVAAGVGILLHHAIWYQWDLFAFPTEVYQLAILMAVFSTVLPAFMVSEGIRIIGANNGAIIGSIGPISTIVLAYIFLDERLGWLQWLGTLLVIGGVLIISLQKHKK